MMAVLQLEPGKLSHFPKWGKKTTAKWEESEEGVVVAWAIGESALAAYSEIMAYNYLVWVTLSWTREIYPIFPPEVWSKAGWVFGAWSIYCLVVLLGANADGWGAPRPLVG